MGSERQPMNMLDLDGRILDALEAAYGEGLTLTEDLADSLDLTVGAVRSRLDPLTALGWVTYRVVDGDLLGWEMTWKGVQYRRASS